MALEREKNKLVLEKCQQILAELLKDEDNKYCVDCDAKSPRWASWNIGIFLCIRCAGIHRNLGVHISKVKSVNLDSWTPQQVACIQQMGNSRARAVYEANLQDNFRRPQTDSSLEQFIRAKYEAKKYIAREWVAPPMPNPTWDIEIEKQLRKKREKKAVSGVVELPAQIKSGPLKSSGVSPKPLPKAPGGRNSSPGTSSSRRLAGSSGKSEESNQRKFSGTVDLLGLDTPTEANGPSKNESNDIFGEFLAAPLCAGESTADDAENKDSSDVTADEASFFSQKQPEATNEKLSKDSILALYNQMPSHSFGGGGLYMGGARLPAVPSGAALGGIPVSGMLPPQQAIVTSTPQQNMMYIAQAGAGISVPGSGMQPRFFPPGNAMYPLVHGGVQLSAANPFSQMQAQLHNLSLSGMTPGQQQQQKLPSVPAVVNNMNKPVTNINGLYSNPAQSTTLATNLWQ